MKIIEREVISLKKTISAFFTTPHSTDEKK
jgi:hypothetical protein